VATGSVPPPWHGLALGCPFLDDTGSYPGSRIVPRMESNTSIAIPPPGRLVTVLEPAVLGLVAEAEGDACRPSIDLENTSISRHPPSRMRYLIMISSHGYLFTLPSCGALLP
jgi:hypothetical protein